MAPHNARGSLNIMFQLAVTIGILAAQLINYGTQARGAWGSGSLRLDVGAEWNGKPDPQQLTPCSAWGGCGARALCALTHPRHRPRPPPKQPCSTCAPTAGACRWRWAPCPRCC
jgi:hypothetical protein